MHSPKPLFFIVLLSFGCTFEDVTAQVVNLGAHTVKWAPQTISRSFPKIGWSSLNFGISGPEIYSSPTLSCQMEGFFKHPSDCTKFYRCIQDLQNNGYTPLVFSCAAGTIFSQELGSCVAGSCSPDEVSAGFECQTEGRFAAPDDCGQYYECVRGRNGDLIVNRQSCFGLAYDASQEECVSLERANGCIPDLTRSDNVDDPNLQNLCNANQNQFLCLDCKTLVACLGKRPQIIPCNYGYTCYNDKNRFRGGVCYPGAPAECTCNSDDIFKPDFYDSSKFLTCGAQGTEPVLQSCPEGLEFNQEQSSCGPPTDTICSKSGTYVVQSDCTKYQTCTYTDAGSFFKSVFTCSDNTMYNEEIGKCEDPCGWHSGTFTCEEEGRFPNPEDCTAYFECIKDPLDSKKFMKIEHMCEEGYEWLPLGDVYHCMPKGTTQEECVPKKPNTCKVPREWCRSKTDCSEADGFFTGVGQSTQQCFKAFKELRTWFQAEDKCVQEGMVLARPMDPVAMRNYLHTKFGNSYFWIGARGTGATIHWVRDKTTIRNDDPLWWSGAGEPSSTADDHCLWLETWDSSMRSHPNEPYRMFSCTYTNPTGTLCELL